MKVVIVSLFLLLMSGVGHSLQAQGIEFGDRIIGYYPFNGDARDMTLQGNDGLVNGAKLIADRFGESNSAYSFDGVKSGIRIPFSEKLNLGESQTLSISVWIKPRDINPGCILLRNLDYGLKWNGMQGPVTYYAGLNGGYPNSSRDKWRSDKWYHLVMIQAENKLSIYVNGELDAYVSKVRKTTTKTEDIYLGKHPYFWGAYAGAIDDLVIYKRALNEYEIQALFQIQKMPLEIEVEESGPDVELSKLTGVWQGVLTQPANQSVPNYAFWIEFTRQGDALKGATRIEVESSNAYGVADIQASVSGDRVNFREIRLRSQKNFQGFEWCKKFGRLVYDADKKVLKGTWYADNCQEGGEIILYRTQRPFNYYDNRLSQTVSKEEFLKRLEEGRAKPKEDEPILKLELENIIFQSNRAIISSNSQGYLIKELVPFLRDNKTIRLNVTGHTDSIGDEGYNLYLSTKRAEAVIELLKANGIESSRLSSEGYGESRPISSNATAEGRAENRRVEFEVRVE